MVFIKKLQDVTITELDVVELSCEVSKLDGEVS